MTDYSTIDFDSLVSLAGDDEVVTHSYVRDIPLTSGKTLALITLDNGRDHTRPNTLGAAPCSRTRAGWPHRACSGACDRARCRG